MITVDKLAELLEEAYDIEADKKISPEQARKRIAKKQAEAFASFVIGRKTNVVGTSATGGPVKGSGTIIE